MEITGPRSTLFKSKDVLRPGDAPALKSGAVTYRGDYKTFDGIPIARREHDGYLEPEVTDLWVVDGFGPRLFDRP